MEIEADTEKEDVSDSDGGFTMVESDFVLKVLGV